MPVNILRTSPVFGGGGRGFPQFNDSQVSQRDLFGAQQLQTGRDDQMLSLLITMLVQQQGADANRELRREEMGIQETLSNRQQREFELARKAQDRHQQQGIDIQKRLADSTNAQIEHGLAAEARARSRGLGGIELGQLQGGVTAGVEEAKARFERTRSEGTIHALRRMGPLTTAMGKAMGRISNGDDPTSAQIKELKKAVLTVTQSIGEAAAAAQSRGASASEIDAILGVLEDEFDGVIQKVGTHGGMDAFVTKAIDAVAGDRRTLGFDNIDFPADLSAKARGMIDAGQDSINRAVGRAQIGDAAQIRENNAAFDPEVPAVDFSSLGTTLPAGQNINPPIGVPFNVPPELGGLDAFLEGAQDIDLGSPLSPFQEARQRSAGSASQIRQDIVEGVGGAAGSAVGGVEGLLSPRNAVGIEAMLHMLGGSSEAPGETPLAPSVPSEASTGDLERLIGPSNLFLKMQGGESEEIPKLPEGAHFDRTGQLRERREPALSFPSVDQTPVPALNFPGDPEQISFPADPISALGGELGILDRPDGLKSSELSVTVTDERLNGGKPTNIPTLVKGQSGVDFLLKGFQPSDEQVELAIKRAAARVKDGASLPSYQSIAEAVAAARKRSEDKNRNP